MAHSGDPSVKEDRLVSGLIQESDADSSVRPHLCKSSLAKNWSAIICRYLSGCWERGDALDHVLLHGPPGLGKTTLARLWHVNWCGVPATSNL